MIFDLQCLHSEAGWDKYVTDLKIAVAGSDLLKGIAAHYKD